MKERKIIQSSKSWRDLDRTIKKLIKNKQTTLAGSIFEHLTKLYFEVSPEYKTKLSKVYLLNEVPNALKKKLKLPNTDEGIDLIAETFDKEYWAIQCKFRSDKTETLKVKGDLATFNNLAFTVCKNISHGIVCATVNRPPKKEHLLNVGYILLKDWLGLDRDNGELFKQIKNKAIGKITKPKKLSPRPHQKKAITKTLSYFKNNERGKMIMPCGTGKSLTAFWIAEKMKSKSILVAVPSLALLQQTLKVWTREFLLHNIQPDWLCVCSDDTVKEEQDDFVTFSADLGIKVDTNPRIIKKFLSKKTNKIKIVFTTYQSGRATAIGSKGFVYDLGIMDEAHKTVGSKTKEMAHLLHQKNIKIKKRLFMTATERLFRGDSDEFMSMDDPRDYGNLIYELSFKEAINSKPPIISDYKIITFGISNPEIESITQDNKYLKVKKELKDITARELAVGIALRKAIKKLKIKNAISFHRSIKRADNFRKQQDLITKIYPTYGKLKTFHVRGDMPTSDRALEMLSFEEEQGLMTNARCLTEGVDLPAIDCVCFTDPKRSKVDIVQAAGRALRLSKGKKFGYILIPIFIPDGMDFSTAAEQQGFDDVATTVRALATTDKRIVEYLRAISEGDTPPVGGSPVDGIRSVYNLTNVEAEEFNKSIQLKIWDKVAFVNRRPFEEARAFVQKLNLKNRDQWNLYCKNKLEGFKEKPQDIPADPRRYYKGEFKGMGDWLGTGRIAPGSMRLFKEARAYVQKLNIKSQRDWFLYCHNKLKGFKEKPQDIPVLASGVYKNEWKGFDDWLGTGRGAPGNMRSFSEARDFVQKLNLKNRKEWFKYTKNKLKGFKEKPKDIPTAPFVVYKDEWKGIGDWLGTGKIAKNLLIYRSFKKSRTYVQKLNLKTYRQWNLYSQNKLKGFKEKPQDIPAGPYKTYKDEFKGMSDWLGTEINWRSFKEARAYVRKLNIKTQADWFLYCKNKLEGFKEKPQDIFTDPRNYKDEFKGMSDWLGNKK
ncbi:DEAD/DEAH box helicase family protein [Candidatus Pelagibacter sp.]|nr:DEAD/DEAH box helicase family protein [Candidatus Pelagibacter sp.]